MDISSALSMDGFFLRPIQLMIFETKHCCFVICRPFVGALSTASESDTLQRGRRFVQATFPNEVNNFTLQKKICMIDLVEAVPSYDQSYQILIREKLFCQVS